MVETGHSGLVAGDYRQLVQRPVLSGQGYQRIRPTGQCLECAYWLDGSDHIADCVRLLVRPIYLAYALASLKLAPEGPVERVEYNVWIRRCRRK